MFRKEFWILSGLAAATLVIVSALAIVAAEILVRDAEAIAMDSIPGLTDVGEASAIAAANWHQVQIIATTPSPGGRAALIQSVMTNAAEPYWQEYKASLRSGEDAENFEEMTNARSNFLVVRQDFFALVQGAPNAEAETFLEQKLAPAYERYCKTSTKLFNYNVRTGRERAARVMRVARFMPWTLAAFGMMLFGIGAVLGLRAAFTGLTFGSRMRSRR